MDENPIGEHEPGALCFGCDADATAGYWVNEHPACVTCIMETGQYLGLDYFARENRHYFPNDRAPWSWRYKLPPEEDMAAAVAEVYAAELRRRGAAAQ